MLLLHRASQAFLVPLVLSLSACGGGDGGGDSSAGSANQPSAATAPAATQLNARLTPFIGRWVACVQTGASTSEKDDLLVSAGSGVDKVAITRTSTQHTGVLDCTGQGLKLEEEQSELTLLGQTVVIGVVTLEKSSRTGRVIEYSYDLNGVMLAPTNSLPSPFLSVGLLPGSTDKLVSGDESLVDLNGNPIRLMPEVYLKQP